MECEDYRDEMLDVLYGEADNESARRVEEHQSACEACRHEMAALRHVRRDLKAWTLPEAPLTLRPQPAGFVRPQWALAMAASLLMAVGAALGFSGSELSYHNGQLAFRLGRAPASTDEAGPLRAKLAQLEQDIQALKSQGVVPVGTAPMPATSRPNNEAAIYAAIQQVAQDNEARMAIFNSNLSDIEGQVADQGRFLVGLHTELAMVDTRSTINYAKMAQSVPVSVQK